MTKQTGRRFTPEYKERAVARLSEDGVTYASLTGELGRSIVQTGAGKTHAIAACYIARGIGSSRPGTAPRASIY